MNNAKHISLVKELLARNYPSNLFANSESAYMRPLFNRAREVLRLQGQLERDGFPRLKMLLMVTITGGVGFLASFALLRFGLIEMWPRYLVAFGIAYLAFLFLLWLWLRTRAEDYADVPDFSEIGVRSQFWLILADTVI
jgi:hypothetical protein